MAKSNLHKFGAGFAAVALATSLVPVTAGSALANDSYWSAPDQAVAVDTSTILKTYGVRAGSAGPDFLGISNTNFDFTAASPGKWQSAQYDQYTAEDLAGIKGAGLAIWATSVNENPNPFYANLMYNAMTGSSATPAATTWVANPEESSWGDSNGLNSTLADGSGVSTVNGLEYLPEIIFGANKSTSWDNFDVQSTNIYKWASSSANTVGYDPTYTNNDASNMWTQLYSIEQLSYAAEGVKDATGLTTRYDGNSTEIGALAYEKSIRGNLLYCASQLDQDKAAQKTVAYLYAIDGDTGYFFVPTADGLLTGDDTNEHASATDAATAGAGYAANNGTINLDYHGVLPFITDTFDSGNEVEGGIVMKVEDIFKSNPACTVSASDSANALADVDIIIYNSTVCTNLQDTSGGKNSSGVNNTEALNNENVTAWAKTHGFNGSVLAGDDYGTSTNQGYGSTAATEDGMSPLLYCQRNYTADKIARAAWVFSQVYPEFYDNNDDASYAYWVSNVYHVDIDKVSTVTAYMTNQSSAVVYDADTEAAMEDHFAEGYAWWNSKGKDSAWGEYAYYNGSTRASFYDGNAASEEPEDTIGIFQPSALWDAASFPDVDSTEYYASSVAWCGATGLIQGYRDGKFGVNDPMTRAQLATILWRYYAPAEAAEYDSADTYPANETGMADVEDNAWYTAAANWAVRSHVIDGYYNDGKRTFGANDNVTFEQLVAIIAKASREDYEGTNITPLQKFNDAGEVSDWARGAMAWAVDNGLVSGYANADGTRTLAPKSNVPRARVATVLVNAIVKSEILHS